MSKLWSRLRKAMHRQRNDNKDVNKKEQNEEEKDKQNIEEREKQKFGNEKYLMVAALDFGTTYSAYAFSFQTRADDIHMNNNWTSVEGFKSDKTPTSLLTKPNGEFQAFGNDAEYQFVKLDIEDTDPLTGFNLYKQFKMLLHQKDIDMSSTVTSTSGNIRPAIDVFTMAIQFLKDHMLNAIKSAVTRPPDVSMIQWVLTVPAIWTDEAKQFMRQAAYKAGLIETIHSDQLLICLEPEAASVYCRSLDVHRFEGRDRSKLTFNEEEKILVIDAGGGTVDIAAHQINADGTVEELIPASGGPWGGVKVDEKLKSLLGKILGADFLNNFKTKMPNKWFELLLKLERAKNLADTEPTMSCGTITLEIPWFLGTEYKEYTNKDIQEVIKDNSEYGVSFSSGYLVISQEVTNIIFSLITENTINHVQHLLRNPALKDLNYMLLVGGFGECKFLQKAVLDAFSERVRVLIPIEAQLAVIKGAVMYGHRPQQVSGRRARATYGMEMYNIFDESKHDQRRAMRDDEGKWCKGCFTVMVKKGELIKATVPHKITCSRLNREQTSAPLSVYCTEAANPPMYTDEPGVRHLGTITLTSPSGPLGEERELQLTFGATEITVQARDLSRGAVFPVTMTIF